MVSEEYLQNYPTLLLTFIMKRTNWLLNMQKKTFMLMWTQIKDMLNASLSQMEAFQTSWETLYGKASTGKVPLAWSLDGTASHGFCRNLANFTVQFMLEEGLAIILFVKLVWMCHMERTGFNKQNKTTWGYLRCSNAIMTQYYNSSNLSRNKEIWG